MKMKPILKESNFIDKVRYNDFFPQSHVKVSFREEKIDKKEYGYVVLFNILLSSEPFKYVKSQDKKLSTKQIINNVLINSLNIRYDNENNDIFESNYKVNSVITFNTREYRVLDVLKNYGNIYLFLINEDESCNDTFICKLDKYNKKTIYNHIENDSEFEFVLYKLFFKNKEQLILFANEE